MVTTKTDLSTTAAGIADLLDGVKNMDDYQLLMKDVFKRVAERALQAEMTQHLGYDKNSVTGKNSGNSRNGVSRKTIIADDGYVEIDTPRDRDGSFEPQFSEWDAQKKDILEFKLYKLVCDGKVPLDLARHSISSNWIEAYKLYVK